MGLQEQTSMSQHLLSALSTTESDQGVKRLVEVRAGPWPHAGLRLPAASRYGLRAYARSHAVNRMLCFSTKVGASRCSHQPILARAGAAITARLRSTPRRTSVASAAAG